jgi:hypothetical protein
LTRLTALQVCSEMGVKEILPVAERLAQSGVEPPIRISAIAVMGRLGGGTIVGKLEKWASDPNPWVANASRLALKDWKGREASNL